jgi:ATP-binding cassette subfamily B protein
MSRATEPKPKTQTPQKANMFQLLKPYSGVISLLILLSLLSNGINLIIPKIISHGIDAYSGNHLDFRKIATEFALAALFIFIFTYLQSIVQTLASERVARDLREKLSAKISRQSFAYVGEVTPAKLLTNLTSDVDSIKSFVSQAIVSIISSIFLITGSVILLLTIDWKLALAVLVIIPVIAGVFYLVLMKVRPLFRN